MGEGRLPIRRVLLRAGTAQLWSARVRPRMEAGQGESGLGMTQSTSEGPAVESCLSPTIPSQQVLEGGGGRGTRSVSGRPWLPCAFCQHFILFIRENNILKREVFIYE